MNKPALPFTSEQVYSLDPPGFIWLAKARLAPLVSMWARDGFVDNHGSMLIQLLGVFSLGDVHGPEIDQGSGLRHWSEVLMLPSIATHPAVRWEPIDATSARMLIEQPGLKMQGVVEFSAEHEPIAFHTDRYMDAPSGPELHPWTGRCGDWRVIDGVRFPTRWTATWHLKDGDFTYVKLEVTSVRTE